MNAAMSLVHRLESIIVSMSIDEWAIVALVLLLVGFLCMRGLGNQRL